MKAIKSVGYTFAVFAFFALTVATLLGFGII